MSNTPCAYAVCSVLHRRVEIKADSCPTDYPEIDQTDRLLRSLREPPYRGAKVQANQPKRV